MPDYHASKTLARFHNSPAFVRAALGPIGSGKSVACVIEMMRISTTVQLPSPIDNIRYSRWVIVRNTYRELIDTTVQTFFDWVPESLGVFLKQDMKFTFRQTLPDGTGVHAEFLFRALDKPADIKKLLSLEVTGGWINECREIPKAIMDMLIGRLGRYPRKINGQYGATRYCLLLDTNPPDSDHWFYRLFEVDQPKGYELFHQPSGISPEAENIANLPNGYYENMQAGKDQEWINVYVKGIYGFVQDGKPVFPEYHDDFHFTDKEIILPKQITIHVGMDFGLTPAAIFTFRSPCDQIVAFDELVAEDMDARTFGRLLKQKIATEYRQYNFKFCGDPAGDFRAQSDSTTPFMMLKAEGIAAYPAWTNDPVIRIAACSAPMKRLDSLGQPGFVLGPRCKILRKALSGGYQYKRLQVTGEERYTDAPYKNRYSHPADAFQYAMLSLGEGVAAITSDDTNRKIEYSNQGII